MHAAAHDRLRRFISALRITRNDRTCLDMTRSSLEITADERGDTLGPGKGRPAAAKSIVARGVWRFQLTNLVAPFLDGLSGVWNSFFYKLGA